MATYKFKLIDSIVPKIRGGKIITDSNVGGTKNTYKVYRVKIRIGKYYLIRRYIGQKSFLRPYQSLWDVSHDRLPPVYWGKGPLLNLWIIINDEFGDPTKSSGLLGLYPSTRRYYINLFNIKFVSHELKNNLNSNQSFYQSNFIKNGNKNKSRP